MDPPAILLDTHTLLWWAIGSKGLGRTARRLIAHDGTVVFVSAASAWEIATKVRLRKLTWSSPDSVQAYCTDQGFELLAVTFTHAEKAGAWPHDHGDPFDRLLAAQSAVETVPLVTNDPRIREFGVETIW